MFEKFRKKLSDNDFKEKLKSNDAVLGNTIYFTTEIVKNKDWGKLKYLLFYTDNHFIRPNLSDKDIADCIRRVKGSISYGTQRNETMMKDIKVKGIQTLSRAHKFPINRPSLQQLIDSGYALFINE